MPSSLSAAASSILLHVLFVVLTTLVVAATAFVPVDDHHRPDVINTTTPPTTTATTPTTTSPISSSNSSSAENFEMYYCFLCTERHPLLIHYCPIYWDECHLNCWDADATAIPEAAAAASSSVQGKECYVMKLYMSGRYVIVARLSCDGIASCFLTCGGGELLLDDDQKQKVAAAGMGTASATTATPVPAATIQGSFVPFELCNTQQVVHAPPSLSRRRLVVRADDGPNLPV